MFWLEKFQQKSPDYKHQHFAFLSQQNHFLCSIQRLAFSLLQDKESFSDGILIFSLRNFFQMENFFVKFLKKSKFNAWILTVWFLGLIFGCHFIPSLTLVTIEFKKKKISIDCIDNYMAHWIYCHHARLTNNSISLFDRRKVLLGKSYYKGKNEPNG